MIFFESHTTQPHKSSKHLGLRLLLWAAGVIVILCVLVLASVPPVSRDALTHHLTIPQMYLNHGGIYEIPSIVFSYFPMNLDLLYLPALYFNNDIAAKYIHFTFALVTAWLIFKYLNKVLNKTYGLLGALFFLTIPVIVKLSVTVYVDLGLICFSWTSLYFVLKWYDKRFPPRLLIWAGIACGLALGTKYNGLLLLPIMGTMIPILYSSTKNRAVPTKNYKQRYYNSFAGLGWATAFILISLIIFSPWMARNVIWKQNPIYPLYNNVFNPPSSPVVVNVKKEKSSPKNAFWMRRHIYGESFLQTLSIPIRAFFQGKDDDPQYFDGRLNPFLLFLPLVAFIRRRQLPFSGFKTHRTVLGLFVLLFMLFVFFKSDFRIRYMAPAIPPLVVLSVFGIKNLVDLALLRHGITKQIGLAAVTGVVLFAFILNGTYIHKLFTHIKPLDYISGSMDRDTYISQFRREHPVILHANKILPEDAQVLVLSLGNRTYYINRQVHLAEDFYGKTQGKYSEEDLLKKLSRFNTTHIILDKGSLFTWLRTLAKAEQNIFLTVFKTYTRVLYEKNDVLLLKLDIE